MATARVVNYLTSERGKKLITTVLCTSCIGSACIYLVPNTVLVNQYQSLFQMYRNDEPVPVEDSLLTKFEQVKNDLKDYLPPRARAKPFVAYGLDPVSAGYLDTLQGAIIGIPSTFGYTDLNDVDENPILVEGRTLNSELPVVEKLKSTIVLSENAKKYAICREILFTNTPHVLFQSVYPSALMIVLNSLSNQLKPLLGITQQPPVVRGIFYTLLTFFGVSLWFFLKDNTSLHYDKLVEEQICSLGEHYIEGGLEYYTKRLERNKALRELMTRGPSIYTVTGNENISFRVITLPLTVKRYYFQEKLKDISNNLNNNTV